MKYARETPEALVMDITPALAQELLKTSPGNRKLRPWYVDMLASAMKRGEWRITSQGIGIDRTGRLRDAHHRLTACIKAGVSFPSVVVMGMREDAYQVTDVGIKRKVADILAMDGRVAETIRLGCTIAISATLPTADQMRPFVETGLGNAASALIEYCGSVRRYFSSSPVKLAACVTIMAGGNADFVMQQYRALCMLDFDGMTSAAQALVRQVDTANLKASDTGDALARALRVFDESRKDISRIQISATDAATARETVRNVLRADLNRQSHPVAPVMDDAEMADENERAREWVVDFLTGLILVNPGLCPHITEALEGILYEDIKGLDILIEVHSLLIKNPTWTVNHILGYFSRKRWHDARNAIARIASMTIFTLPSAVKAEPVHLIYLIERIANNTALQAMRRGPKLI